MKPKHKTDNIKEFENQIKVLSVREFELSAAIMNATNNPSLEIRVRELNITRGKIKVLKERIARLNSSSPDIATLPINTTQFFNNQ
jgi:hypothetical protein